MTERLTLSLSLFRGLESSSSHFLVCLGTNLEQFYEDHVIGSLGTENEQWRALVAHTNVLECASVCVCTQQNNGDSWHETMNSTNF